MKIDWYILIHNTVGRWFAARFGMPFIELA